MMQIQRNKITPYIEGQRQAGKGRYFNRYSIVSQRQFHNDFEAGWKDKQGELHPNQVITRTWRPQLAVLILAIILVIAIYCLNS